MKTTTAYTCICQDCNKVFRINETMVNAINLDDDHDVAISFLSASLNRITCPHCNAEFTYEIPMLVFSPNAHFAIKVDPHIQASKDELILPLPCFFRVFSYRYRLVTYHIEALEKVRIFKDGLDDRFIEYVKLKFFSDADATPMEDVNLCYKSSDSENLYFEKLDYNGNLIKEYSVKKPDISRYSFSEDSHCLNWQQINRYTIENYINKEENLCQG